jgi:hypothetical protein
MVFWLAARFSGDDKLLGRLNSTRRTYRCCWLAGLGCRRPGAAMVTRNNNATVSGSAQLNGGLTTTNNTRIFAMSKNT